MKKNRRTKRANGMPNVFKDARFMSAREKDLVLKSWKTFISHGMQLKHFTKRLYKHLSLHCSFIAHYDRFGFYDVYFALGSEESARNFLRQFDRKLGGVSVEYGTNCWLNDVDYADINNTMCKVVERYRSTLDRHLKGRARQRSVDLAKSLLERNRVGYQLNYKV